MWRALTILPVQFSAGLFVALHLLAPNQLLQAAAEFPALDIPDRLYTQPDFTHKPLQPEPLSRPIGLKSGWFVGKGAIEQNLSAALEAAGGAERVHVIIQLRDIPSPHRRREMKREGINLLEPLGGSSFFASLRRSVHPSTLANYGVRWLGRIYPADRLSARLSRGTVGPWVFDEAGRLRLIVKFFSDVSADEASALLSSFGHDVIATQVSTNQWHVHVGWDQLMRLAEEDIVRWIEEVPPPIVLYNDGVRAAIGSELVTGPPYNLSGSNVFVGIWDGGFVDDTHPDLAGRVIRGETNPVDEKHPHATHVAGTLAGSGVNSQHEGGRPFQWRGVAPAVTIVSYDVDHGVLEDEIPQGLSQYPIVVLQNSWGITVSKFIGNCDLLGSYPSLAAFYDRLVHGDFGRPVVAVFAAGNNRGRTRPQDGCPGMTYGTIGVPASAKNVLAIGAVNSDTLGITSYTSWGPTDDGRIKPDVVAPGDEVGGDGGVTSTAPGGGYSTMVGTSMAAPAVSGAAALLIEAYRQLYNGLDPQPATVRALLIHTAMDLSGEPALTAGPDYASGYGLIRIDRAIEQLYRGGFLVDEVGQGEQREYQLTVREGDSRIRITLVWDDPAGVENAALALVNDLDLIVFDPDGNRYYPWTLDPNSPTSPARRDSEDHLNPVEVVDVPAEAIRPGNWRVIVRGSAVPGSDKQRFTLAFDPPTIPQVSLLEICDVRLQELAGNGNGVPDPGEEIQELVVIRHIDGPAVSNLVATILDANLGLVKLIEPISFFPTLQPGRQVTNVGGLLYRVLKDAACGAQFNLSIAVTNETVRLTTSVVRQVGQLLPTNSFEELFLASDTPKPIPDPGTTASELLIERSGVLRKVRVGVRIDHTWAEDLRLELQHPDGTRILLAPDSLLQPGQGLGTGPCDLISNWLWFDDDAQRKIGASGPYVGSFQPYQPLSQLAGKEIAGTWRLVATDTSPEDSGIILCWGVEVEADQQGLVCNLFNRPPTGLDQAVQVPFETATPIRLDVNDPDDDPLAIQIISEPLHGTLRPAADSISFVYTPQNGYVGEDKFVWQAIDGYGGVATGTVNIQVLQPQADLQVDLIPDERTTPGEQIRLRLKVANLGPNPATAVTVQLLLPEHGLQILEPGIPTPGALFQQNPGLLQWQLQSLAVGEELSWDVVLSTGEPGLYCLRLVALSDQFDPVAENTAAERSIIVQAVSNLKLIIDHTTRTVPLGLPTLLQIGLTNDGPYAATNVIVRLGIPEGIEVKDVSIGEGGWNIAGSYFTASFDVIDVGSGLPILLQLQPNVAGELPIKVLVESEAVDLSPQDNEADITWVAKPLADLVIRQVQLQSPIGLSLPGTNTLLIANLGPADSASVHVQVSFPPLLRLLAGRADSGQPNVDEPGRLTWDVGPLASGQLALLEWVWESDVAGTNWVEISVDGDIIDPDPTNNTATAVVEVLPVTDLSVALRVTADRLVVGYPTPGQLCITNHGPADATSITASLIQSEPGLQMSFQLDDLQGVSIDPSEDGWIVHIDSIKAGAELCIPFYLRVSDVIERVLTVSVGSYELDPVVEDNSIQLTITPELPADLSFTIRPIQAQGFQQLPVLLSWTLANAGPGPARGIRLHFSLADQVRYLSGLEQFEGWDPETLTLSIDELPQGQAVTGSVSLICQEHGSWTNHVELRSESFDTDTDDITRMFVLNLQPIVRLGLQLIDPPTTCMVSQPVPVRLLITNTGPNTATNLFLRVLLPTDWTWTIISSSVSISATNQFDNGVVFGLGPVLAGEGAELVLQLVAAKPGSFTSEFELSCDLYDPEPADNRVDWHVQIVEPADVQLLPLPSPLEALQDTPTWFTLAITNAGPAPVTSALLELTIPSGVEVLTTNTEGIIQITSHSIQWQAGPLVPGESKQIELAFKAARAGLYECLAQVSTEVPDPEPSNNRSIFTFSVLPTADVMIQALPVDQRVGYGLQTDLTILVRNIGPSQAESVEAQISLDQRWGLFSITPSHGYWGFGPEGIRWSIGQLEPDEDATLTLRLIALDIGSLTNIFSVRSETADPETGNNAAASVIQSLPPVNLTVFRILPPERIAVGVPFQYTLVVSNAGPFEATDILVREELPPSVDQLRVVAPEEVAVTEGQIIWTIQRLGVGERLEKSIELSLTNLGAAQFIATVTSADYELSPEDNTNLVELIVRPLADLGLTLTHPAATVIFGQEAILSLSITNQGPDASLGIELSVEHSPEIELVGIDWPDWLALQATASNVWAIASLDPSTGATINIHILGFKPGTGSLSIRIRSDSIDPTPDDSAAVAAIEVIPVSDLAISDVWVPVGPAGYPWKWHFSITNQGPNVCPAAETIIPLPSNTRLIETNLTLGTITVEEGKLHWIIYDLDAAGSAALDITVITEWPVQQADMIVVRGSAYDPEPEDNGSELVFDVRPVADLALALNSDRDTALVGTAVNLSLEVTNAGPMSATNLCVQLDLADGLVVNAIVAAQWTIEQSSNTVRLYLPQLPPQTGQCVLISVTGQYEKAVSVSASAQAFSIDLWPENNSATWQGELFYGADLAIEASPDRSNLCEGCVQLWIVAARNLGPQPASDVQVIQQFSGPIELIDFEPTAGSCTFQDGVLIWDVGSLEPSDAASALLRIRHLTQGAYNCSMRIESRSVDVYLDNNELRFAGTIYPRATVTIEPQLPPAPLLVNAPTQIGFKLINTGTNTIQSLNLLVAFSTTVQLQSVEFNGSAYRIEPPGVVAFFGDVEPGQEACIIIRCVPTEVGSLVALASCFSYSLDGYDPASSCRVELPVSDRPYLTYRVEENRLILSWPAAAEGFIVEYTEDLSSGLWEPLGLPKILVEDRYEVRVKLSRTMRLFRLRQGDIEPATP